VYEAVVKHGYTGIDPEGYQPVEVRNKETRCRAWVHFPGSLQPRIIRRPDLAAAMTEEAPVTTIPRELPADTAAFTGRDRELGCLLDLVAAAGRGIGDHPVPIRAIDGIAGIGKSALAVHAAHELSAQFPDGQLYVNLQGTTPGLTPMEPGDVLRRFLRTLGLEDDRIPTNVEEAAARFRSLVTRRRLLLLLDNAATAEQVRPLLPAGSTCAVLVTSRDALVALDGARRVHLDVLPHGEAIELLGRLAGVERIAAEPGAAARVAELCGRLPLALRIAGARLAARPGWTIGALADRLADAHRRLDELALGDLQIRASFQLSYQRFASRSEPAGPLAARMFRMLGLLNGRDVSTSVAAALIDQPAAVAGTLVEQLVDAQLLETPTPGRYTMHDLLRLFAREHAVAEETPADRDAALQRVLRSYLVTVSAASRLVYPADRQRAGNHRGARALAVLATRADALAWIEAERTNLVAIARQVAKDGSQAAVESLLKLTLPMVWPLGNGGHLRELLTIGEAAVRAAQRIDDPQGEINARIPLAYALIAMFRFEEVRFGLEQALTLCRQLSDRSAEGRVLGLFGMMYCRWGRFDQAVSYLERALPLRLEFHDRRAEMVTCAYLGQAYAGVKRLDEAQTCLTRSLVLSRELDDDLGEASVLQYLGQLFMHLGDFDKARDHLEEALRIRRGCGSRWGQTDLLADLAEVYSLAGDKEAALASCERRLAIHREYGNRRGEGQALRNLGRALQQLDRREQARTCWHNALAIFEELGAQSDQAEVRALLASA
jgi:tetratricopeptide (TPR) repeat protein